MTGLQVIPAPLRFGVKAKEHHVAHVIASSCLARHLLVPLFAGEDGGDKARQIFNAEASWLSVMLQQHKDLAKMVHPIIFRAVL